VEPDTFSPSTLTVEEVFYKHAARIYNVARRMLQHTDAEDVTQEVLLQVVRKLTTFRNEADVSTWLYRVTVNAALAHRRRCARRAERQMSERMEHVLEEDSTSMPPRRPSSRQEQKVLDEETRNLLENAITALPPLYRDVYILAELEGLSNAAVADLLAMEVSTVKSRLHRARLFLREKLSQHFEEIRVA
jgi:RNA polymerase sigma-70 factor (ECF subfamily)